MNYIIGELIDLNRDSQWLWLSLKLCLFSHKVPECSGHCQSQCFILSNLFCLPFPKHATSLTPCQCPESPGAALMDISRFEASVSPTALDLVLSFWTQKFLASLAASSTECLSLQTLCLLAMNEHFSLLVQIQSFSTTRHFLRSAALWRVAHSQLRPDSGKMLSMGTANWKPVFVEVCQNSTSFCCYGVSSAPANCYIYLRDLM